MVYSGAMSGHSYRDVADPATDLYQMLGLSPAATEEELESGMEGAQRWWNAQQANPRFRDKTAPAQARLREARQLLLDPIRRQEYDRDLQALRQEMMRATREPVLGLIATALDQGELSGETRALIVAFAERYGVHPTEAGAMIEDAEAEAPQRPATVPAVAPPPQTEILLRPTPSWAFLTSALLLGCGAALGIWLVVAEHPIAAVLLGVPWLNDLRLVALLAAGRPRPPVRSASWEWFLGLVLLGGATLGAMAELWPTAMLPLGFVAAGLVWTAWVLLTLFLRRLDRPGDR